MSRAEAPSRSVSVASSAADQEAWTPERHGLGAQRGSSDAAGLYEDEAQRMVASQTGRSRE